MNNIEQLKSKLFHCGKVTREETVSLIEAPLGELCVAGIVRQITTTIMQELQWSIAR